MKKVNDLNELKEIELSMMKKVHEFCVSQNIDYYLAYGTLLGAIRHNGFIPWDDDIDIWMKRDDYEKFLKEFPKYASNNGMDIVNPYTKTKYNNSFTKIVNTNTILKEKQFRGDDEIGVFIDVFPLYYVPENEKLLRKYKRKNKLLSASRKILSKKDGLLKRIIIKILQIFLSPNKLARKTNEMVKKACTNYNSKVFVNTGPQEVFWTKYFDEKILHKFEDTEFYIPKEYDAVLKSRYGDYMKLPPLEMQVPHHISDIYIK